MQNFKFLENLTSYFGTFNFKIGSLEFEPTYIQAILIVFLLFVLIWTIARLRNLYLKWSLGGWYKWFFLGMLFAFTIEGFFMVYGKSLLVDILGWKGAPKPLVSALDSGRSNITKVLGTKDTTLQCTCE